MGLQAQHVRLLGVKGCLVCSHMYPRHGVGDKKGDKVGERRQRRRGRCVVDMCVSCISGSGGSGSAHKVM